MDAGDLASPDGPGTGPVSTWPTGPVLDADVVVVGIGVVPAIGWLGGLGPHPRQRGGLRPRSLFAADQVVAAGDVARWHHPTLG